MKFIESRSYLALLGLAAFSVLGAGCNTVEGVGQDVEALGDNIEDAARDARD